MGSRGEKSTDCEAMTVQIHLNDEESSALRLLLEETLGDMSHEIVGTDNALYRRGLRSRRTTLESILSKLGDDGVLARD